MGSKKKAALHGVSKKERAKLERRAAELEAEIERREKKAAKKAAKKIDRSKVKKAKALDVGPLGVDETMTITAEAEAPVEPGPASDVDEPRTARDETIDPATGQTRPEVIEARKAKRDETQAELDAAIKARVKAKRAAREAGEPVDVKAARMPDALEGETEVDYQMRKLREKKKPAASSNVDEGGLVAAAEEHAIAKATEAVEAIGDAIEAVETETGTIYAGGPSVAADAEPVFAKPSEAPKSDFESNGLGQYLVKRPEDGKLVGYTRVTSYIRGIEDDSAIVKWKLRVLLEGAAAAEEMGDAVTARVRDLVHNRDLAITKARKADRKGKLAAGELATYIEGAWRDFKRALDKAADEMIELGGGREKAAKGTDLHALFELHDTEGMQAVADLATLGQITPADLADVEAYAELVASWGIRFVDVERVVVNDAVPAPTPSKPGRVIGVAGRLDRTGYVKLPGETRARKRVIDIKTGSLEYSKAEISRQLASYAMSKGYDLDTHEREDMKLDQKTAVVIHLPAGSAKGELWAVDLVAGRKGLKIIADMRANRNEGKGAMTLVEHEVSVD